MKKIILVLTIYLISTISVYAEFSFTFEWGDIKKCTTGNPNTVSNQFLIFQMFQRELKN